ncbi:helix-turn-helix transcriptional regulator [Nocardia sp. NPDC051052]|uniref:helix-turn-helix transcriptional regulator n=1 Tax=Nocardia sp. NPDC051052 TaxID=3364322 RepID=UPI0037B2AC8E
MTTPPTPPETSPAGRGTGRRADVLASLRASPVPLSILELAAQLDLHPNTVRFHLDALVSAGQAERVQSDRSGPGRPPQMFRAYPGMDPAGPRNYRVLAEILTAQLATEPDPAAHASRAGRGWGRQLIKPAPSAGVVPSAAQAVGTLVEVLDHLDFAPHFDEAAEPTRIRLRHCPFLDMTGGPPGSAGVRPDLVCAVHLGLMQGVLESQHAPVTVDRLEPFAEPDLCLAHLRATGARSATTTATGTTP